jgi:hypothetical protein
VTPGSQDLARALLRLAASVAADGGAAVRAAATAVAQAAYTFDAAELVVSGKDGPERWALGPQGGGPLVAKDVLDRLAPESPPVRIDDASACEAWPETAAALRLAGMASSLVVPLAPPAPAGALVLARRYGWAFVGASLRSFVPLARTIGVCHDLALRLTSAVAGCPSPRDDGRAALEAEAQTLRREWTAALAQLEDARGQLATTSTELRSAREELATAQADLATARLAVTQRRPGAEAPADGDTTASGRGGSARRRRR